MPRKTLITLLTGLEPKVANFVIELTKDWAPRRAAEASGYAADYGYTLQKMPEVEAAIDRVLMERLEASHIDAEWVLMEAIDNHRIARQQGNISASNTALGLVMKHTLVDAIASDKLNMNVHADKDIMKKIIRGRDRLIEEDIEDTLDNGVSFL